MIINAFFLFFYFLISHKCHYFVTYLENPENFNLLKNNIGFVHKYYKSSYAIVILDIDSGKFSDIVDQISYWRQVHIVDKKNIFLNYKQHIVSNYPTKAKLGIINYIFENFFFTSGTKIFCFDIFVSLFKSRVVLLDIFTNKNISFSENHILLDFNSFNTEFTHIMLNIKLNRFGIQDFKFLKNYFIDLKTKKDEVRNNTLSCRINFKNLHYATMFFDDKTLYSFKQTRIAILLPTLNSNSDINENPLIKHTIPSLAKTISKYELQKFNITIYIAYDSNDIFLNNENSIEIHRNKIFNFFGNSQNIFIKYTKFPVSKSVVFLWNTLFVESFKDGNDYFVQLNDDSEISKSGWLTETIKHFDQGFDGVVGFNSQEWGCKLYTQTIVSKKHYIRNFGNFYPMLFHNAMSDIWITEFYKNNRKCLHEFKTNNHFSKTRYRKCPFNKRLLKKVLKSFNTIF